jgi:uncharacterized hydrophobic protein (TIGR00341 family)
VALRLIEITIPERDREGLEVLLKDRQVVGVWTDPQTEQVLIKVLVSAEDAEPVLDHVEQRLAGRNDFHVVMLPVEASIPRPEAEAPSEETPGEGPPPEDEKRHRISREELYQEIADSTKTSTVFMAMAVLSAVVAAVGLMRNDVATVIGAMVIAPLLGPNVALALATTLGDLRLALEGLRANLVGISIALVCSVAIGISFKVDPSIPAIVARTRVGASDIIGALAAGAAGTLAFTTGLSGAVIGVMVAVALLPPLVTFGLLMGSGYVSRAFGALLLLTANIVCVNLAGVITFLVQGVQPRTWWEAERAKKATMAAMLTWALLLLVLAVTLMLARPGVR